MASSLPSNASAEIAILRAAMVDPTVITRVGLVPEDFTDVSVRLLWDACKRLTDAGTPLDPITIERAMTKEGDWSDEARALLLGKLQLKRGDPSTAEHHALILKQLTDDRRILIACTSMMESIQQQEDQGEAQKQLREALEPHAADVLTPQKRHDHFVGEYSRLKKPYLPVPIPAWGDEAGGLLDAGQTVLGARPNIGKTALALFLALHLAMNDYPVLFLSLESSAQELHTRLVSQYTWLQGPKEALPLTNIRMRQANKDTVRMWSENITQFPIYIEDRITNLHLLEARTRAMVHKLGIRAVFLDHVGKVSVPENRGEMRERQTIGDVSRTFFRIAKDCDIATVLISHLNRTAEGVMLPTLAHLRMSGDLENDADEVYLMAREEKSSKWGNLIRRKARDGEGDALVKFDFIGHCVSFAEFSEGGHRGS